MDSNSCNLLRSVARQPDSIASRQLSSLTEKIDDWDSLLEMARQHRVLPLLAQCLAGEPAVPLSVQQSLQVAYQRNVLHALANAAELLAVFKAFEQEAIPAMPFKGVVLASSVYRDVTARAAGDLDLLIRRQDLQRATAILLQRGFELTTPTHPDRSPARADDCEYHFERPSDGMVLEIRWKLEMTYTRFRSDLGLEWVWPERRTALLAGAEVPDICPEINLLLLCMHGSKHLWSRLLWITDVARLIHAFPALDWNKAMQEARRTGLWRPFALGVLLAHSIAGASVPTPVLKRFEADAGASRLAQHIEENLFTAPGKPPAGSTPYNIQLLSFQDRARLFLSLDFLRPNERDRAAVPLPQSLRALYYLVRPIRLLYDRSARA